MRQNDYVKYSSPILTTLALTLYTIQLTIIYYDDGVGVKEDGNGYRIKGTLFSPGS